MSSILKLSFGFLAKLGYEYTLAMLKYLLIGGLGLLPVYMAQFNPIFALIALFIGLPAFCYSFWRGYVVTYALNFAALDFIAKNPLKPYKEYVILAKEQESKLIKFVSFMAVITLIGYIPSTFCFANYVPIEQFIVDPIKAIVNCREFMMCSIINTVILAQFLNFGLQALFVGKKDNYFKLLINCYTNTGFIGFIISNMIIGITTFLGIKAANIYLILFLPLNLIIYSMNLFWYIRGVKKG